jgi:hypothetical protein
MFNEKRIVHRILLGPAAFVAVIGIGGVAYGVASESSASSAAPLVAVGEVQTVDAVAAGARVDGLSESEAAGIVFMREEEKLARDVYLTLHDAWGLRIFENIAASEQTHMDAVLGLIEAHGLDDPVGDNQIGVFVNTELQAMYDDLVASGSDSVEATLGVGALIEEVDIEDLAVYLEASTASDVVRVYERLLSGSENHLRAFASQLESYSIEYEPTVLDTES